MIRSLFCLVVAACLLGFLSFAYAELPTPFLVLVGFFGLLFCFIAWGSIRHHTRLMRARKCAPVAATIFVRCTPQRRGPDRLVAEITIGNETWRGTLTGWSHERVFSDQTLAGLAWLAPKTGAPLEFEINGQIITPIPIVMKVNQGSVLETVIQKFNKFDE